MQTNAIAAVVTMMVKSKNSRDAAETNTAKVPVESNSHTNMAIAIALSICHIR